MTGTKAYVFDINLSVLLSVDPGPVSSIIGSAKYVRKLKIPKDHRHRLDVNRFNFFLTDYTIGQKNRM